MVKKNQKWNTTTLVRQSTARKMRLFDCSVGVYNPSSPVPGNSSTVIYRQTSQQSPKADLGNTDKASV